LDNYYEDAFLVLATVLRGAKRAELDEATKSFSNLVELKIKSFNGMIVQKGGRHLIG
jgi:hypothetical protein